ALLVTGYAARGRAKRAQPLLGPAAARPEVRVPRDHEPLQGEVLRALEPALAATRLRQEHREPALERAVAEPGELLDRALEKRNRGRAVALLEIRVAEAARGARALERNLQMLERV